MALISANVETRAPVPAAGLTFSSSRSGGGASVSFAGGGVGATKGTDCCRVALGGVTRSGDTARFMVELLPLKLGTCMGPY